MTPATLRVQLESELPGELDVGRGTAVFVCGWCFCPQARIRSLSLLVAGEPQPVMAHGMPRLDPYQSLQEPRSYRSGFWGIAQVTSARPSDQLELGLQAELDGGGTATAELARLRIQDPPTALADAPWPTGAIGPPVAIAMATYNPSPELLEGQLDSIRAQTHQNWVCVISDDG